MLKLFGNFVVFMIICVAGCYLVEDVLKIESISYAMMFGYFVATFGFFVADTLFKA